jgi:hypothetical protein
LKQLKFPLVFFKFPKRWIIFTHCNGIRTKLYASRNFILNLLNLCFNIPNLLILLNQLGKDLKRRSKFTKNGVVDCGNIVEALTTNEFGCECWWRVACYVVAGHQHCTGSLRKRALAKQRFLHKVLCLFALLCVILFLRRLCSQRLRD